MSSIASKIIAPVRKNKLAAILQHYLFMVYLDETTWEIKGFKYITFLARYVDPDTFENKVELLTLISLYPTELNATDLFEKFKEVLDEFQIPIKNVMVIAIDNASVMAGFLKSVKTELKKHCPAVLTITCICHKLALIARHAFKVFLIKINKFLQDLHLFAPQPKFSNFEQFAREVWSNQFN